MGPSVCYAVLKDISSFATISLRKREELLYFICLFAVMLLLVFCVSSSLCRGLICRVTSVLDHLQSLESRRTTDQLTMMFTILHGLVDIHTSRLVRTRTHSQQGQYFRQIQVITNTAGPGIPFRHIFSMLPPCYPSRANFIF